MVRALGLRVARRALVVLRVLRVLPVLGSPRQAAPDRRARDAVLPDAPARPGTPRRRRARIGAACPRAVDAIVRVEARVRARDG